MIRDLLYEKVADANKRWNFLKILSLYQLVCYITWLDATMDDLQTRPSLQILLFFELIA